MPSKKLCRVDSEIIEPRAELPTVPDAFQRSDYEGLLLKTIKRWQLKSYLPANPGRAPSGSEADQSKPN